MAKIGFELLVRKVEPWKIKTTLILLIGNLSSLILIPSKLVVLPKLLDKNWLISVSEDAESKNWLTNYADEQVTLLKNNTFNTSKKY